MRFDTGRNTARLLLAWLRGMDFLIPQDQLAPVIKPAIDSILRSHISGTEVDDQALLLLVPALNQPIDRLEVKRIESGIFYLEPRQAAASARHVVEMLLEYLEYFKWYPQFQSPLAVCGRPGCASLFVKKKSHARFCSPRCKEAAWRRQKKQSEPRYYADKKRDERRIAKKQKEEKRKAARNRLKALK